MLSIKDSSNPDSEVQSDSLFVFQTQCDPHPASTETSEESSTDGEESAEPSTDKPMTTETDKFPHKDGKSEPRPTMASRKCKTRPKISKMELTALLRTTTTTTNFERERNTLLRAQIEQMQLAHRRTEIYRREMLAQRRDERQKADAFRRAILADERESTELKRQKLQLLMGEEYRP